MFKCLGAALVLPLVTQRDLSCAVRQPELGNLFPHLNRQKLQNTQ
jgi:hypothetical protein